MGAHGNSFGTLGPSIGLYLGISDSPERLTTLPQALFFFLQKNGSHLSGSPERLTTLPQALFFSQKNGPHILGGFLLELFAIAESETLNKRCNGGPQVIGHHKKSWFN